MQALMPDSWLQALPQQLQKLQDQHLQRHRREVVPAGAHVKVNGQPMLQFCSNDYLGLSQHPALIEAARQGALEFGVGAGDPRWLTATAPPMRNWRRHWPVMFNFLVLCISMRVLRPMSA